MCSSDLCLATPVGSSQLKDRRTQLELTEPSPTSTELAGGQVRETGPTRIGDTHSIRIDQTGSIEVQDSPLETTYSVADFTESGDNRERLSVKAIAKMHMHLN